jgi:hypothetical protein
MTGAVFGIGARSRYDALMSADSFSIVATAAGPALRSHQTPITAAIHTQRPPWRCE